MIYALAMIGAMLAISTVSHAQSNDSYFLNLRAIGADRSGVKAARQFWHLYGEGKNERWYKLSGGYLAEFEEEGIHHKLVFDKAGNWLYTMREYTEKELSREVRHLVKSSYYDFTIGWVKEVIQDKTLTYVIHIDSPAEWKDLVVRDGEIEIQREFARQP